MAMTQGKDEQIEAYLLQRDKELKAKLQDMGLSPLDQRLLLGLAGALLEALQQKASSAAEALLLMNHEIHVLIHLHSMLSKVGEQFGGEAMADWADREAAKQAASKADA